LGLKKTCKLLGFQFDEGDDVFEDFDPGMVKPEVYWMWCQDGTRNREIAPKAARAQFAPNEIGLTAMEGLALVSQDTSILSRLYLVLAGSVRRGHRNECADLDHCGCIVGLRVQAEDLVDNRWGTPSRGV
jgi:hypothetical protein